MSSACQFSRYSIRCSRWLKIRRMSLSPVLLAAPHHDSYFLAHSVKNFHSNPLLCSAQENDEKMTATLDKEEELLSQILDASLEEVLTHGWSLSAVKAAVTRLGYPPVTAGLVDNVEQLVLHHIDSSNKRLDTWMEAEVERLTSEGQRLKIGPFVRSCIVKRLSLNIPLLEAGLWSEGVARVCQPGQGLVSGLEAWQTVCDDIWHRAGDTSADMNWYTKRISLGAVMAATDVFMIQDKSDNFQDTWNFLDRRLDDLQMIPTITKLPEDFARVADSLFQTAKILVGVHK